MHYIPQEKQILDCHGARDVWVEWDLSGWGVEGVVKGVVDVGFVQKHRVLPLKMWEGKLWVGFFELQQLEVMAEIKFHTDMMVQPVMVDKVKLERLISEYVRYCQYDAMSGFQVAAASAKDDAEVVRFVEEILLDAGLKKASDIHFEPYKTTYRLRFRIDGILHKISQIPIDLAQRILARLKVMAKMDIAERRLPQDGRFQVDFQQQKQHECRVSTCPTLFGEKMVIRILEGEKAALQIDDLGFEENQKNIFLKAIGRSQGMVLVTGPTGSGKTRTLYTAIDNLNTMEKNILTVEDPVEIQLPGVNQVHIHPKIGLTFATTLRAFLRQDPDIIMLGEIRDAESAEIAIKAAQTGHLVLSTLHTNSTIEAVLRLQSMGVAIFDIVHSVQIIVAQRLLRRLCQACKQPAFAAESINPEFLQVGSYYRAVGCDVCMQGYNGRIGIFEILEMEENVKRKILQGAAVNEIELVAKENGMRTLQEVALDKIKLGITSSEEMLRVVM